LALQDNTIQQIIDLKSEDENNRDNPKFKGVLLSNRDVSEVVFGVRSSESTVRRVWKKYKQQGHYQGVVGDSPIAGGTIETPDVKRKILSGKKFVITSVQNNTHIHQDFFNSILRYCEEEDAELLISSFYYNKNGFQNGKREDAWFDERVKPYMVNESLQIAKGLVFSAELNILPTAVNPLTGLYNYTNHDSMIVPHAKLQMESMATPKFEDSRMAYATGCVSLRNYRSQKAGQKAEHDHSFSALVVEVDSEGDWFVRQLNCESSTGNFYDLDKYYTPKSVTSGHEVEAINYGDIHAAKLDWGVAEISWLSDKSILDTLKPKYQFVHDVFDALAKNWHNVKDPHFLFSTYIDKTESMEEEVKLTAGVLASMKRDFSEVVVVESNHDLGLLRFLREHDYRKDPVNAVFFLEMQLATYKAIETGDKNYSCFEHACFVTTPETKAGIRFLRTDESFRVCGDIECGQHGHNSSGGARGSVKGLAKQGHRMNTGHTHNASIFQGIYTAGVSGKMDMGYNVGGSAWNQSHILTYKNGKRTILTLKNGKWRG
jgi:hypothetical protein